MKNIAYITLGCKLNYAETSTFERELEKHGFKSVPWSQGADVYLVNTCTVTEHSDKKCRNFIRRLNSKTPNANIYVTGCYAELKKDEILKISGVKAVFGAKEKALVCPVIIENETNKPSFNNSDNTIFNYFGAFSSGERTRSFLKVQDGCDYKCNYCTIPYARGESRNESISEVVKKAEQIAALGVKEVVITGVNTGDFGKSTGESFFELIKELNKVEGIERYRISSIEPNLLTTEMIDWIASGSKFLPHFHIPLQSGCDAILKEMGRRYTCKDFADKIAYIRKAFQGKHDVFFGIDVIVGFPGESSDYFNDTYTFLKDVIKPAFIHIFPYSKRAGTPAAIMKNQVQDSIKTQRVKLLEELSEELHNKFIVSQKGKTANVLFESSVKGGMMFGYSENYVRVSRKYDKDKIGMICQELL